jgi:hypothetical protein
MYRVSDKSSGNSGGGALLAVDGDSLLDAGIAEPATAESVPTFLGGLRISLLSGAALLLATAAASLLLRNTRHQ